MIVKGNSIIDAINLFGCKITIVDRGGSSEHINKDIDLSGFIPNNEIWYTSKSGKIITPTNISGFPTIVSNTYKNGKGIIQFDNDVPYIGDFAFQDCLDLTGIALSDSVETIRLGAFSNCTNLQSVEMPRYMKGIYGGAFNNCIGLQKLINKTWKPINITLSNPISTQARKTVFWPYPFPTSVYIDRRDGSVFRVYYNDLKNKTISFKFSKIQKLSVLIANTSTISSSETADNIIYSVLLKNKNEKEITPEIIESWGPNVIDSEGFIYIRLYTEAAGGGEVTITSSENNGVLSTGDIFTNVSTLIPVYVPDTSYYYDWCNFSNFQNITEDCGFCGDSVKWSLQNNCLTIFGEGAMMDYSIEDNLSMSPWVAYKEKINEVVISPGVTSIGKNSFCGFFESPFNTVIFPSTINSIGEGAFYNCENLANVYIPKVPLTIYARAFYNCYQILSLDVPSSVTFSDLGTDDIDIFKNILNINYEDSFDTKKRGARSVNGFVEGYFAYNDSSKNTLVAASIACSGDVVIPTSVTTLSGHSFLNCTRINTVFIPNNVISIGLESFNGCSNLRNITLSDNLSTLSLGLFRKCNKLDTITIPEHVTLIESEVFYGCSSLTSVNIPDGVLSIGSRVFYDCSNITHLEIPYSVTSLGSTASNGGIINSHQGITITLHRLYLSKLITQSTIDTSPTTQQNNNYTIIFDVASYDNNFVLADTIDKGSQKWVNTYNIYTDFQEIVDQARAFSDTYTLMNVYHLDGSPWTGGQYIDGFLIYQDDTEQVLMSCIPNATGDIVLPNSVVEIQDNAFANCVNISSVEIPSSVVTIGDTIFSGLTSFIMKLHNLYSVKLISDKESSTSTNSTYTAYFYDIQSIPTGWTPESMLGKGASKNTITYNMYTDYEPLKNSLASLGDSHTTVNIYHLDGSSWT